MHSAAAEFCDGWDIFACSRLRPDLSTRARRKADRVGAKKPTQILDIRPGGGGVLRSLWLITTLWRDFNLEKHSRHLLFATPLTQDIAPPIAVTMVRRLLLLQQRVARVRSYRQSHSLSCLNLARLATNMPRSDTQKPRSTMPSPPVPEAHTSECHSRTPARPPRPSTA